MSRVSTFTKTVFHILKQYTLQSKEWTNFPLTYNQCSLLKEWMPKNMFTHIQQQHFGCKYIFYIVHTLATTPCDMPHEWGCREMDGDGTELFEKSIFSVPV